MKNYFKLLRVHHYIKNLLVFLPLICSGKLFDSTKLIPAVVAFISFCLISSVGYVINDINDVEKDRLHPTKKNRPLAAKTISINRAKILAVVLFCTSIAINFVASIDFIAIGIVVLYFVLNLFYSRGLKNIPIVDISILVLGFVLRVLNGAIVTGINISNWLYLCVFTVSFFFAIGKRRNELQSHGSETRKVLKGYPIKFLDSSLTMCLTLTNVFYALWSMDKDTMLSYHNKNLIYTFPIVFLITLKYYLNIEGDSDGDPVEVLLHDKILIGLCLVFCLAMFSILYLL